MGLSPSAAGGSVNRWLGVVRPWVVHTRRWPMFETTYRAAYELGAGVILSRLEAPAGVSLFVRERRDSSHFEAGVSDLDLLAVLEGDVPAEVQLERSRQTLVRLARAQRWLPLVRDVHFFTRNELGLGAGLAGSLESLLPSGTRSLDDGASIPLPMLPQNQRAGRVLAQELVTYTTLRAARQRVEERGELASVLAAHALAKAEALRPFAEGMRRGMPAEVAACHGSEANRSGASFDDIARALHRLDSSLSEPTPDRIAPAARLPHAGVSRLAPALAEWARPLLAEPAIRSVALLVDSPSAVDVRLAIVLEAGHARAADAIATIAARRASTPPPRVDSRSSPLRLHLVTAALLERPGRLRLASLEPWLRESAFVLGDPLPPARVGRAELARSLALGLIVASSSFRERADQTAGTDECLRACAMVEGLLPAANDFLAGRTPRMPVESVPRDAASRLMAARALHAAMSELVPSLVDAGRAVVESDATIRGT